MTRFARYMLVAALMVSIGAQWAALQTAAWVGMAVSYSVKTGSVAEGLKQTFDGNHPCKLCCVVKKGSDSQKKDPQQETAKLKIELFAGSFAIALIAPPVSEAPVSEEPRFAVERTVAPLLQPPRCV